MGSGYTLVASASSLAVATSAAFDVTAAAPSATVSSVVASPTSGLVADGTTASTVTITVRDAFGNGVPGQSVVLAATGTANTFVQPGLTDAFGVTVGTVMSTHAERKTITASIGAAALAQKPPVTFVAGAAANLVVTSGDGASGTHGTTAPIVVTVTDANGNDVSGTTVTFAVTLGDGTLSATTVTTGALGTTQTTLTFGTSGIDTITAQVQGVASSLVVVRAVAVDLAAKVDFATGSQPGSVAFGDLNGDGKPDLAVANENSNTVSVFLNSTAPGATTPSFAPNVDFATGLFPLSIAVGDLNGDGRPDLAVVNESSRTVSVFLNTTAPGATTASFTAKVDVATGSGPVSIAVGDLNGDGKPDLAVANASSNTVSVLLNATT